MDDGANSCVLYVFDSLRYDAVGGKGGYAQTPVIDSLANDGFSFENAWAQATWTYASSASIFSGLYPGAHGCHQFDDSLTEEMPHLTDFTAQEDIVSACFSTTYGVSPERGFEQSFDYFYYFGADGDPIKPGIMEKLNDTLLPWVKAHADQRFFVVVWAMGTHHPYLVPDDVADPMEPMQSDPAVAGTARAMQERPANEVDEVKRRYGRAVTHSDEKLGEIVELLRELDQFDDTTLVVTSDHGEVFDEHARMEYAHPVVRRSASAILPESTRRRLGLFEPSAFVGHQGIFPSDELIHVPLVYKPGSCRWNDIEVDEDSLVELVDILPTIRKSLGLNVQDAVQGRDLISVTSGNPKQYVYSATRVHGGPLTFESVGDGVYKYVRKRLATADIDLDHFVRAIESFVNYLFGRRELLLHEDKPISDEEKLETLKQALADHNEACDLVSFKGSGFTVDEQTKAALEDLGYR